MANAAEITHRGPAPATAPAFRAPSAGPALTRNEVLRETLGGRTWLGALSNLGDRACAGVSVRLRFIGAAGRAVGAPVSARTNWLEPGASLHLQARLPAEATALEIIGLRWTAGGRDVELAPTTRLLLKAASAI